MKNKRLTIAVANFYDINVAKSIYVEKSIDDLSTILQQVKLPVFVKANNGGSSLGTNRVETIDELPFALDSAFKEDHQVMVEEANDGRESTIDVYKLKGEIDYALSITEVVSDNTWFDFKAKYNGQSIAITPAKIDKLLENEIRKTAVKIYEIMECSCVVRIDFI